MFIYQCILSKLFLGIFTRVKKIYWNIFTTVFLTCMLSARQDRSTVRSTAPSSQSTGRSTDVHRNVHAGYTCGRSTERLTDWEQFALCLFGSILRSTGSANGSKYDRWAVDRSVDRQGNSGKICCQRLVSRFAYIYPFWKSFSLRFFVRIFPYSLVFLLQLKEVFGFKLNNLFGVFIRVWKIKEKGIWEKLLNWTSLSWFCLFPKDFLWVASFKSLGFLHTWAKIYYLLYRILCGKKRLFCGCWLKLLSCKPYL